jgi:hypothetical protein
MQLLINNLTQEKLAAIVVVLASMSIDFQVINDANAQTTIATAAPAPSIPAAAPATTSTRPDFILPANAKLLICKALDHDPACWDTNIIPTTNMGNVAVPHSLVVEGALRPAFKRQGLMSGACFTAGKVSTCPDKSAQAQAEQIKSDAELAARAANIPNVLPNASTTVAPSTNIDVTSGITPAQLAAMFSAADIVEVDDPDAL